MSIDIDPATINGILVTHDHTDHTQGIAVFSKKYNVPVYATAGTLNYISGNARCVPNPALLHIVRADSPFDIGGIHITPFATSHDAIDPVCYSLEADGKKLGMATDLGFYDDYIVAALSNSDALYLEANHDINMLMLGSYPYCLKTRIASNLGHLSNETCGELLVKLRTPRLKSIVLAHISKENNFPELAYETVRLALENDERYTDIPYLVAAKRHEPTGMIRL